jgi:hypothetical protein
MEAGPIRDCKALIEHGTLQALQDYYAEMLVSEDAHLVDWPFVLQKIYIHACLKKKRDIATWLESKFGDLDPISFIAYRQTIAYGKHLLKK